VDHPRIVGEFHRIAVPSKALGIGNAVIAQRVAFSDDDQRRRQDARGRCR
jgi:hypothetical protein